MNDPRGKPGASVRRCRRGRSAFTLVEVLVSLAILSTVLVVVLLSFQSSLTLLGACQDTVVSSLLMREKIGEVEVALLTKGKSAGDTSFDAMDGYAGDVKIEPLQSTPLRSNTVYEVQVTVRREVSGTTHSLVTQLMGGKPE